MTIATDRGFVVGNKYMTKDSSWVGGGHLVTFTYDDDSHCPAFQGPTARNGVEFFENLDKLEFVEEAKESVRVNVELNADTSIIVVQRKLTADEVAAVLKAINA